MPAERNEPAVRGEEQLGADSSDRNNGQTRTRIHFFFLVSLFIVLAIVLKLPSLNFPRTETDERIYWQLAENIVQTGSYSLQGTEILPTLSSTMYDRPLFHHPPLYTLLLTPFVMLDSPKYAIVVSWLGHLLCILSVTLVLFWSMDRLKVTDSPITNAAWLPLLGIATDPLLTFVARKLWIDSLLAGLIAVSAALLLIADDGRHRRLLLIGAGALLGLAALTKLSALAMAPVYIGGAFLKYGRTRRACESALLMLLPAGLLVLPWLVLFYIRCGAIIPSWVKADPWLVEHNTFVRAFVNRPWGYYFIKTPLLVPLFIPCVYHMALEPRLIKNDNEKIAFGWMILYLIAITVVSALGVGFLMRHVAAAMTPLYVLMFYNLKKKDCGFFLQTAFLLCVTFGAVTGGIWLVLPGFDEIMSWFELCRGAQL